MPRGKNKKKEQETRAQEVRMSFIAPLWKRNWTLKEMSDEAIRVLGLKSYALSTVKADVQRLLKEWQMERLEDVDAKVTAELMRLDVVIREAWEAWGKSKKDHHIKKQKRIGMPTGGDSLETIKAEPGDIEVRATGDPRYLDVILKALDQRRKLLGLDRTTVDVNANFRGAIEIRYVGDDDTGISNSEEEIRRKEGMTD